MGSKLLVVYLPMNYYGPPASLPCVIGKIRLLDLTERFLRNLEADGPKPYIVGDGHPRAAGNEPIVDEIVRHEGLLWAQRSGSRAAESGDSRRRAFEISALARSERVKDRPDEHHLRLVLQRSPGVDRARRNDDGASGLTAMADAVDLDPDLADLDQRHLLVFMAMPRDRDAGIHPIPKDADARCTLLAARQPPPRYAGAHQDFRQGGMIHDQHCRTITPAMLTGHRGRREEPPVGDYILP
jgi:hypothetical protein